MCFWLIWSSIMMFQTDWDMFETFSTVGSQKLIFRQKLQILTFLRLLQAFSFTIPFTTVWPSFKGPVDVHQRYMRDLTRSTKISISHIVPHFYKNLCDKCDGTEVCGNVFIICILSELTIILTDEVKNVKKCWWFSQIHWWSLLILNLLNFEYLGEPV